MESSEHAVDSHDVHQSKDKNRKSKRAPQELYVPKGRRHNAPTAESTANSQKDVKAVDKPEEDQSATRISAPGTKQQPRRNEKKRGREGNKGKQQRERKASTDGEGDEGKEAKEKAEQNKGKHGRRREQQRYVPRPLRDDVKTSKTSGEEGHLIKQNLDSVQSGDSQSSVDGRSQHAEKKLPGQSELSQKKNASPVPEDWDEIDCDDRDLMCHPTGTRLTVHGKLIPVNPDDDASLETSPAEMQARVQELETSEVRVGSVSRQNESAIESKDKTDAEPNEGNTVTEQDVTQAHNDNATTDSNKVKQDVDIVGECQNARNHPSAWTNSNIQKDGNESGDASTSESLCRTTEACDTPEQNIAVDEASANSQEKAEKLVTLGICTDLDPNAVASVSANAGDVDSNSLQPEPPAGKSVPPSSDDVSNLTANNPPSNTLLPESSSTDIAPSRDDTDICKETQRSPNQEAGIPDEDQQTEIELCKEEAPVIDADPDVSELDNANGDDDGKDKSGEADDDDWDTMFDESGDCLKQEEMEELSEGVGNVQVSVKQSKKDYYNYQPKDNTDYSEFEHVIEVFDFPADFKTQDLIMGFSNMKTKEMDIKWIDDTHALAIFPTGIVAQDALSMSNPMFRTRPLLLASREAKMKARHCQEFLLPSKPRPETSAATARRLVSGALGLKSNVSKEQRAAERSKIKEAKDRRRMEKRQQEDIWDGNI